VLETPQRHPKLIKPIKDKMNPVRIAHRSDPKPFNRRNFLKVGHCLESPGGHRAPSGRLRRDKWPSLKIKMEISSPRRFLARLGRTRGATSAQVALARLLAKQSFIVPIPGTTKLAHLEENLRAADLKLSASEVSEIEEAVSRIKIVGARYPADQQQQVEG
jgi:hypothetical protein